NAVLASLTAPILPTLCNVIESFKSQPSRDAVLHLHYADGGLAQITDLASLPLPGLGEEWVKYSGNFFSYPGELFGNFDPFVPIPCPSGHGSPPRAPPRLAAAAGRPRRRGCPARRARA